MELKNFFAQDDQGKKVAGATCYLYRRGTESLVSGLLKANGVPLSNPFTTDHNGLAQFAAANGLYDVRVVDGARDYRLTIQFNDVSDTAMAAKNSADRAEVARDVALLSAGVFTDIQKGLAATVNGEFFSLPSTASNEYLILYQNSAGVGVEVKRYPSASAVSSMSDALFSKPEVPEECFLFADPMGNVLARIGEDGRFSVAGGLTVDGNIRISDEGKIAASDIDLNGSKVLSLVPKSGYQGVAALHVFADAFGQVVAYINTDGEFVSATPPTTAPEISPGQYASPRPVILDTDWWTDCDDVGALRLALWAEKIGVIDIAAVCVDANFVDSPGSIDAFMHASGRRNNVIAMPKTPHVPGGSPPYQAPMIPHPHTVGYPSTCPDAVSVMRRTLAAATEKTDIIAIGYMNNLHELMQSPADAISPMTGLELITAKVGRLWAMAGAWPNGKENNFTRTAQSKAAGAALCSNWPTPITFLGYEVGISVITGGNLLTEAPADLMTSAYAVTYTSARGRPSWDPLLVYLAIVGDPVKAGFSVVNGMASVNASTGENTFTVNASGPHQYVVKAKPDNWYVETIDPLYVPGAQPNFVPVANGAPIQGIAREASIGLAQPVIPDRVSVGVDAANLWSWFHADDLVDLVNGAAVTHWEDRKKKRAFRQTGSLRPVYVANKNGRKALSFSGAQSMFTNNMPLPWKVTVYMRVQWDVAPSSTQALFIHGNLAETARSLKLASSNASALAVSSYKYNAPIVSSSPLPQVATGAYQTLVGVRSGANVLGYLNGVASSAAGLNVADMVSAPMVIGAIKQDASAEQLAGFVSEIRIYCATHDAATVAAVLADMA